MKLLLNQQKTCPDLSLNPKEDNQVLEMRFQFNLACYFFDFWTQFNHLNLNLLVAISIIYLQILMALE